MLTGEDKKLYKLSEKFSYVKTFLVAVKGFKKIDLDKLNALKKELSSSPEVSINNQLNNKKIQQFKEKYTFYSNDFNYQSSSEIDIENKLSKIYNQILSSPFYFNIDTTDPLKIIAKDKIPTKIKFKNGNLILDDYGYLAIFSIESKIDEKSRIKIYDDIHTVLAKYKNIKAFSSIFYYVENSKAIQNDVKTIIIISMIFLGILYLLILKNFYLFINVVTTLATSVIIGQIIITYIFPQVSIIALAFSTAITSVSIDYMFHHYLHNYYNKKLGFNKSVFYGFITTITAFILISSIDFPLIKQISIFTIISLTTAYVHFSFIYPFLEIKHIEPYSKENYKSFFTISSSKIIIFSLILMLTSILYVNFDFNIKNLDYQNKKLLDTEYFFKSKLNQNKKSAILITGTSIDNLISNAKIVQKIDKTATIPIASLLSQNEYINKQDAIQKFNFTKLKNKIKTSATEIGFKENYFQNSYCDDLLYPSYPHYNEKTLQEFGFDLIYDEQRYITYAMVNSKKVDLILTLDCTKNAQSSVLFENSLKKVHNELLLFGSLTLLLIISILVIVTKKRFLLAFTYILFPTSLILCYGIFVPLNIMHIFMAFIILAIGIDYGIYMNELTLSHNTTLSIIYSLISTFAGFGVLIISNINSLYSIAIAAIIGIFGILFLLLFQKRFEI